MTGEAWVFLAMAIATGLLLAVALAGDAHVVAENRRLRAENARLRRHPATPAVLTLFTGGTDGGAA